MSKVDFSRLTTEGVEARSVGLDAMSTEAAVLLMNDMDAEIAPAVRRAAPAIARTIDRIREAFLSGGRLLYCGAGTSGRLGVLDASECPPTFGADPSQVVGLIAGGDRALRFPIEGAEDSPEAGAADMERAGLSDKDVLVAISASGYAPYCQGALEYAERIGAFTACVVCVENSRLSAHARETMAAVVGPEILTGSTRLRAGTATKMILNMLTTLAMVGCGKVYGNLMVDVKPSNVKLHDRAERIVMAATGCSREEAVSALRETLQPGETTERPKTAIVMLLGGCGAEQAEEALRAEQGFVRRALERLR